MEKNEKQNVLRKLFSDEYVGQSAQEQRIQKRAFISLVILSFLALGFGSWYIADALRDPFRPKVNANSSVATGDQSTNTQLTGIEGLRTKDTDGDGLSDYNEFYGYKTSAYIADSDSDGLTDKQEIDQGTDPNCPSGENCARTVAGNVNTVVNGIFGDIKPDDNTNSAAGVVDPENLTSDELRKILRDAGASEELLGQIPDDELLETYQQLLNERGDTNTNNAATGNNTGGTITLETLQNLSVEEIRQFLIESGVPEETLAEVDDATLLSIFQESLEQNTQGTNTNSQ